MYYFTIKDILFQKLSDMNAEMKDFIIYQKTLILFDIWEVQKKLGYLYDEFVKLEKREKENIIEEEVKENNINPNNLSYRELYISFLMDNNLIFLEEIQDNKILIYLIYYWLLSQVKHDKNLLDNF